MSLELLYDDLLIYVLKLIDPYSRLCLALANKKLLKIIEDIDVWDKDLKKFNQDNVLRNDMQLIWINDKEQNKTVLSWLNYNKCYNEHSATDNVFENCADVFTWNRYIICYDTHCQTRYAVGNEKNTEIINFRSPCSEKSKKVMNEYYLYAVFYANGFNKMQKYLVMVALINIYYCFGTKLMKSIKDVDFLSKPDILLSTTDICINNDSDDFGPIYCMPKGLIYAINLNTLIITGQRIKKYPKELCYFPQLEIISLYENGLTHLPDEFYNLTSLRQLSIGHNYFKSVPNVLNKMPNLTHFDFSNSKHIDIISIDDLVHLKTINLNGCDFKELPDIHDFLKLNKLEVLLFTSNVITVNLFKEYRELKKNSNYQSNNYFEILLC